MRNGEPYPRRQRVITFGEVAADRRQREAEEEARLETEREAEAARMRADAEAREREAAAERQVEADRVRREADEAARARAEAEARQRAEADARAQAQEEQRRREAETAQLRAEADRRERADAEARRRTTPPAGPALSGSTRATDPEPIPFSTRAETPARDIRRPLIAAAIGVLTLGGLAGWWMSRGVESEGRPVQPAPERSRQADAGEPTPQTDAFVFKAARGGYAAPDPQRVSAALSDVRSAYAIGGVSEVARASRACFERLTESPGYGELDYCLAYDAYGAALARRLANGAPPTAGTWFARTEDRALEAAQGVLGEQGDPGARMLDLRRLTVAAAQSATPVQQAEAAAPPAPAPAPPTRVTARAEAANPQPVRAEAVAPARPEPAPVQVARAEPRPAPARVEPRRDPAPRPQPQPTDEPAPRVLQARAGSTRPSFNCRYARTPSERMVCSDPQLAAADRQLNRAFSRAMAESPNPRALRREQDRWLAAREAAAPDPSAVYDVYQERIDELTGLY